MHRVILITGCSRGFGRLWALGALKRGHRVVAIVRDPQSVHDISNQYADSFLSVQADVRDNAAIEESVKQGISAFSRIDVVINNAGYTVFSPTECIPIDEAIRIIDTNLIGSLRVIQCVLPGMRKQGSGHIIQISSIAGLCAFPGMSMYTASKWAVEGLLEALANEVTHFGINVSIVEPGPHLTDWVSSSAVRPPAQNDAYPATEDFMASWPRLRPRDPSGVVEPLFKIIDSEAPPLRILIGDALKDLVAKEYKTRLSDITQY